MLRRIAFGFLAIVCCAALASGVLAKSSGDLVGSVTGKTSQKGGLISPTFDVTKGRLYNASGTFRCSATASKTYQFYSNGLALKDQPKFHFGRSFTFKLNQRWLATGQNPYKPQHYQKGRLIVTITGTIKQVKPAPHSARGHGKASGSGSVTFSAPGCKTGKLSWSGSGQLNYF